MLFRDDLLFLRVRAMPPSEPLIFAPSVRRTLASSVDRMICIRPI